MPVLNSKRLSGFFLIISILFSCNSENKSNEVISDDLSSISIYSKTNDVDFINNFIQQPLLDSLLPINKGFESVYTFYTFTDIKEIKSKRFILSDHSLCLSGKADTTYNIGDLEVELYKDYFGKGQRILVVRNEKTKELNAQTLNAFQGLIAKINQDLGLDGGKNYRDLNNEKSSYSDSLERSLKSKFGIQMSIPSNFKIARVDSNFIWFTSIKNNGGYLSFSIEIKNTTDSNLNSIGTMIAERNESTALHYFNDEGTKMVVSELGSYNPKYRTTTNSKKGMRGWFTEEATVRRGPFGRYYFTSPKNKQTFILDWFCQGSETYNEDVRILECISHSFKLL
jgi:hypothetical protein